MVVFREQDIDWRIVEHGYTQEMLIGKLPCGIDSASFYKKGICETYNYNRAKKRVIKKLKSLVKSANKL